MSRRIKAFSEPIVPMKEISTNEEKANEICKRHIFDSNHFDCCMEMAKWKDEQAEKAFCELCQTKGQRGCNGGGCDNLKLFKSKIE